MFKDQLREKANQAIAALLDLLRAQLRLRCVLLFGSYARGDFTDSSDVDVCVVADGLPGDMFARRHLRPRGIDARLRPLAFTPGEFLALIERGSFLVFDIMAEGIVVYDDDFYRRAQAAFERSVARFQAAREPSGWRFRARGIAGASPAASRRDAMADR